MSAHETANETPASGDGPVPAPIASRSWKSDGRPPRRVLVLAASVLAWERAWPRLWPLLAVAGVFSALALLDILPHLPAWLHVAALAGFAVAACLAAAYALTGVRRVAERDACRRLERDSGFAHRPLSALEDDLAVGREDPVARALWAAHVARMSAITARLRVRLPSPGMARIDPRALRVLVLLILVVGLSAGFRGAGDRFVRAAVPDFSPGSSPTVEVDVWLTPPAYTGLPPVFLRAGSAEEASDAGAEIRDPIRVPAGSTVLSQVTGPDAPPDLIIGDEVVAFSPLGTGGEGGPSSYRVESEVRPARSAPRSSDDNGMTGGPQAMQDLVVMAGSRTLARWPLHVTPDETPRIQFNEVPTATADAYLHLSFRVEDDYGVTGIHAVVQQPPSLRTDWSADIQDDGEEDGDRSTRSEDDPNETVVRFPLPIADPGAPSFAGYGEHDLTAHSWAGLEAPIYLEAEDGAGQVGISPTVLVHLPERTFTHPVARAVIAERKKLTPGDPDLDRRRNVADALQAIGTQPETFAHDVVISLALSVAQGRLRHDRGEQTVEVVREMLWEAALRLEQGTVPIADRRLRQARERLLEALRSDASSDDIERLMDELQQALNEYLSAVAAELARQGSQGLTPPPMGQMLRGQDLQQMVTMARRLARSGARDSAHQLLSQLQQILDGIRSGLAANRNAEELMEAQRLLDGLQELAGEQQDLLDQTFDDLRDLRDGMRSGKSSPPPSGAATGAAEQDGLRRSLGDLMSELDTLMGSTPAPLGQAEQAMGAAADALSKNRLADAVPKQTEAVEQLREAVEATAGMMAQQLGGALGAMFGGNPGGFEEGGSDPFGRLSPDGLRGLGIGDVKIPDRMETREVEEILRELRRRAGEYDRPVLERHYIERLLRRF